MGLVTTSTLATATGYGNQKKIDKCQNGVRWMVAPTAPVKDTQARLAESFYSTDQGKTWVSGGYVYASSTSSTVSYTTNFSFFIDIDDYAHFVFKDHNNGYLYYRRGTPNAGRTAWTWSAEHTILAVANYYDYPDVVAHREGTGWVAHVVFSRTGSGTDKAFYHKVNISSGGAITSSGASDLSAFLSAANTFPGFPSIDFHHTGDGKSVKDNAPHLFVSWSAGIAGGSGQGIRFKKATYSAGTWTWHAEREIDNTYYIPNTATWLNCMFDGTRVNIVGNMNVPGRNDLRLYERDVADTTTTAKMLISDSGASGGGATYDSAGNIYILSAYWDGARRAVWRKWTRSSDTLSAPKIFDSTSRDDPFISPIKPCVGDIAEYIYTDGASAPYNITYGRTDILAFTPTSTGNTGTIQTWTVPSSGQYRIRAVGAQGGNPASGAGTGGKGADMQGDFNLTAGQVLNILVGHQPPVYSSVNSNGGGGGTFVCLSDGTPLIVAGGGNGATTSTSGPNARTTNSGTTLGSTAAAGGAGLTTNGGGDSWVTGTNVAYAYVNGGKGGGPGSYSNYGGFGGGGCTHGNNGTTCPGGGGYEGGDSGTAGNKVGGGSYNNGTSPVNQVYTGAGSGFVEITSLYVPPAPPTITPITADNSTHDITAGATIAVSVMEGNAEDTVTTRIEVELSDGTPHAFHEDVRSGPVNATISNTFNLPRGSYRWRARTSDGNTTTAWTAYRSFTVTKILVNLTFTQGSTGRTGSLQTWTVPRTGNYTITVKGARGGNGFLLNTTTENPGGMGAVLTSTFSLTQGQIITMMIGQVGLAAYSNQRAAGGGGGTFVVNTTTNQLLLVAGGGGGAGNYVGGTLKNASLTTSGNRGTAGGSSSTPSSYGNPGTGESNAGATAGRYAGNGGSYSANGLAGTNLSNSGGSSYTNGGAGGSGASETDAVDGGYGGGGAARLGGGGGGGYGGGSVGDWSYAGDGGGGGSYSLNAIQGSSVDHTGHGRVIIIENNNPPDKPTNLSPDNAILNPNQSHTFTWTYEDDDGDPQAGFSIARKRIL